VVAEALLDLQSKAATQSASMPEPPCAPCRVWSIYRRCVLPSWSAAPWQLKGVSCQEQQQQPAVSHHAVEPRRAAPYSAYRFADGSMNFPCCFAMVGSSQRRRWAPGIAQLRAKITGEAALTYRRQRALSDINMRAVCMCPPRLRCSKARRPWHSWFVTRTEKAVRLTPHGLRCAQREAVAHINLYRSSHRNSLLGIG
jgi:hypothetical protein